MAGTVVFASLRQEQEWDSNKLPALLRQIVDDVSEYAVTTWGWLPCITSIYRTPAENTAALAKTLIHCDWRAVDLRTRGVDPNAVEDVTGWANDRWVYDPMRPTLPVAYSAEHGTGPHLHLQIHSRTQLRAPVRPAIERA